MLAIARRALRQTFSVARARPVWRPEPPLRRQGLAPHAEGVSVNAAVVERRAEPGS
jgi:hypothetical protein